MTPRSLRLLSFLLLTCFTFCSSVSEGPAHVVKQYFILYDAQDVDGFLSLMSQSNVTRTMKDVDRKNVGLGDLKNAIRDEMGTEKERKGELESIEVLSEDLLKDFADVKVRVKYRNGNPHAYRFRLVKEDSQWKIDDKELESSDRPFGFKNLNR